MDRPPSRRQRPRHNEGKLVSLFIVWAAGSGRRQEEERGRRKRRYLFIAGSTQRKERGKEVAYKEGSISCHQNKIVTCGYCLISSLQQEDDVVRMNLRPCLFDRRNGQFERRRYDVELEMPEVGGDHRPSLPSLSSRVQTSLR